MKNPSIPFLFFMLLSIILFGQDDPQKSNFSLAVNVFPNYSLALTNNNGTTPAGIEGTINEYEIAKPSISANLLTSFQIDDQLELLTGLGYMNTGWRDKRREPNTSTTDPEVPDEWRIVHNFEFLEIPVLLKYTFASRFYALAGVSGQANISAQRIIISYFRTETEKNFYPLENIRKYNLSLHLGTGYNYYQTENLTYYLQPHIQFGLLGVFKPVPLNRNMLSLGIATGIILR